MRLRLSFVLFTLVGCAPQVNQQFVDFHAPVQATAPIEPQAVVVLEERFPDGLTLANNVLEVEDGYEHSIALLGRVELSLKAGWSVWGIPPAFYDPEDKPRLQMYCRANPLNYLPWFVALNYVNPLTWPCFALKNHSGERPKNVTYRRELLKRLAQEQAAAAGGDMVVGFQIGGIAVVDGRSGAALANKSSWSATGWVVRRLKGS